MANTLEFEAKTTQEALDIAVRETGIPLSELKFEIVAPGGSGIFGLKLRKARIKVFLPEQTTAASGGLEAPAGEGVSLAETPARTEKEPDASALAADEEPPRSTWAQPSRTVQAPKKQRKKLSVEDIMGPPPVPKDRIDLDLTQGEGGPPKRRRSGRRAERSAPRPGRREAGEAEAERTAPPTPAHKEEVAPIDPAHVAIAQEALERILAVVLPDARVEGGLREDKVYLNIIGDGSGLLIGRKGQTLDAIQFIVGKILDKKAGQHLRLMIDTEGYRSRREASLKMTAQRLAERVIKTGRAAMTGPLNPHDRRIIHLTLHENKRVKTRSHGEGTYKKVVVSATRGSGGRES